MGLGLTEILLLTSLFLLLFGGGSRLPRLGRALGQSLVEFKKAFKQTNKQDIDVKNKDDL